MHVHARASPRSPAPRGAGQPPCALVRCGLWTAQSCTHDTVLSAQWVGPQWGRGSPVGHLFTTLVVALDVFRLISILDQGPAIAGASLKGSEAALQQRTCVSRLSVPVALSLASAGAPLSTDHAVESGDNQLPGLARGSLESLDEWRHGSKCRVPRTSTHSTSVRARSRRPEPGYCEEVEQEPELHSAEQPF